MGVVDRVVTICRDVYRPYFKRQNGARIYYLRVGGTNACLCLMDVHIRRGCDRYAECWRRARCRGNSDDYKPEGALFGLLKELPFYSVVAPISLDLIVIFFVTSSDSGSLVIDTITAGGKMDVPVTQRVFWCTLEGLVAIALLLGGGLNALQGAAVSTGIPLTLVILVMCYCLWIGLKHERQKM